MAKIAFFNIPAYGHTNPTLAVVRELTSRGHCVSYYSYESFRERIEAAGARFIGCDTYDAQLGLGPEDGARIAKDTAFSIHVLVETTLALDAMVCREMERERPDCLLSLGQDGFRPGFSIERVAINLDCPPDAPIDENGPAAYFSTLPVRELAGALNAAGFSARVSYSAGTEACNHVMYAGCRLAGLYGVALSGLVHLPLLPEQRADAPGRRGMRAMPLPEQLKAVGIMLAVIADRLAREK